MTQIRIVLVAVVAVLLGTWFAVDGTDWSTVDSVFRARPLVLQATGLLAIGAMSVAMLLAIRPVALETPLGGLDKMYRLHQWLGVVSLVASVAHWLAVEAPKWAVGLALIGRGARPPRRALPEGSLQSVLASQRDLAETLGEWGFYAALLLIGLALLRRFPYRAFVRTHRLLAVVYVALAWHSVVLLRFDHWATPLGLLAGALLATGTFAALRVLLRRVAANRKVVGEVAGVIRHDALDVVELDLRLRGRWAGHEAGQFAFVTLHREEGPHPFTLSTPWTGAGHVGFIVKALGDYTRTLAQRVKPGDEVVVEGPYGRFDFDGPSRHQVWIGGGIGITPFIARMKALANAPDGRSVDLFHTTAVLDPAAIALLERDARAAGVRLHVLWDERDGRLELARIVREVPHWAEADYWFCGPAPFGDALARALEARGIPPRRFHRELFAMR